MNKLIGIAAVAFCVAALAADVASVPIQPTDVIAYTVREDGTTNVWTAAEAVDALGLMNRKYWRDMQSVSGRRAWHGAVVSSIVDTNALVRIDTYADGFAWTNKWTRPKSEIEIALERAKRSAASWRAKAKDAPPEVAEIYLRRANAIMDKATNGVETVVNEITVSAAGEP